MPIYPKEHYISVGSAMNSSLWRRVILSVLSFFHFPSLPLGRSGFLWAQLLFSGKKEIMFFTALFCLVHSFLQSISIFIMFSLLYPWLWAELLIQESFPLHQYLIEGLMPCTCNVLLTVDDVLVGSSLPTETYFLVLLIPNSSERISVRQDFLYQTFNLSINKYAII